MPRQHFASLGQPPGQRFHHLPFHLFQQHQLGVRQVKLHLRGPGAQQARQARGMQRRIGQSGARPPAGLGLQDSPKVLGQGRERRLVGAVKGFAQGVRRQLFFQLALGHQGQPAPRGRRLAKMGAPLFHQLRHPLHQARASVAQRAHGRHQLGVATPLSAGHVEQHVVRRGDCIAQRAMKFLGHQVRQRRRQGGPGRCGLGSHSGKGSAVGEGGG